MSIPRFKIKCPLPSGQIVYINELNNYEYLALSKYMLNGDLLGFYQELDRHITETISIENFDSLLVVDKIYLYIALYVYSIKPDIQLARTDTTDFSQPTIYSLFNCLSSFKAAITTPTCLRLTTVHNIATIDIGPPRSFELVDTEYRFNPFSAIRSITLDNEEYLINSPKDFETLNYLIGVDDYTKLIEIILNTYNDTVKIVPKQLELSVLDSGLLRFIAEKLYAINPDNLYTVMYHLSHNINMSFSDYFHMSPIESTIMFNKLVKEKQDEQERINKENQARQPKNMFG